MKVITLSILINFLTGCGTVDTVNVGGAKEEESEKEDKKGGKEEDETEEDGGSVTTTTTTTTTTENEKKAKKKKKKIVGEFELVNANAANSEFVSSNYCIGSNIRDCWIRSGYLTENSDGTYDVSIEFWDTYSEIPYTVESKKIKADGAFLLTDKAKIVDDLSINYRMLWAMVDPENKTMDVFYDWSGDGPNRQGDDILESFEFQEINMEGN